MDKAKKNSSVRAGAERNLRKASPELQEALAREVADLKDKIAAAAAAIAARDGRRAVNPETASRPEGTNPVGSAARAAQSPAVGHNPTVQNAAGQSPAVQAPVFTTPSTQSAAPVAAPSSPDSVAASFDEAMTTYTDALDERLNEALEAIVSDFKSFMDASLQGFTACLGRITSIEDKIAELASNVRDAGKGVHVDSQEAAPAKAPEPDGGRRERGASLWYSKLMAKGTLGENYSELIVTASPFVINGKSVDHWSFFVHHYENELSISLRKNDLPEGLLEKWPSEDKWGPVFRLPWTDVLQCTPDVLEKAGLTASDAREMSPRVAVLPSLTKEALVKLDERVKDFWTPLIGAQA